MPRPRTWTDDQLRAAVAVSRNLNEVVRRLGVPVGGKTYTSIRQDIDRLGIDSSHLASPTAGGSGHRRSWTDDDLRAVVASSHTLADVLRGLGYTPNGGMHRYMNLKIRELGLDTSHFLGRSWARGRTFPEARNSRPLGEILVVGSTYPSAALRRRLIAAGLKPPHCEICGLDGWRGAELPLALDHINGEPSDNRLENLRILCPNCHAQTDTWCARNRRG